MAKFTGEYPDNWPELCIKVKEKADGKCERCGHKHDPANGYALTVHHLDGNKANCEEYNLAALCQRCHLSVQGRVNMFQDYMLHDVINSSWMKTHYEGMKRALESGLWP